MKGLLKSESGTPSSWPDRVLLLPGFEASPFIPNFPKARFSGSLKSEADNGWQRAQYLWFSASPRDTFRLAEFQRIDSHHSQQHSCRGGNFLNCKKQPKLCANMYSTCRWQFLSLKNKSAPAFPASLAPEAAAFQPPSLPRLPCFSLSALQKGLCAFFQMLRDWTVLLCSQLHTSTCVQTQVCLQPISLALVEVLIFLLYPH